MVSWNDTLSTNNTDFLVVCYFRNRTTPFAILPCQKFLANLASMSHPTVPALASVRSVKDLNMFEALYMRGRKGNMFDYTQIYGLN